MLKINGIRTLSALAALSVLAVASPAGTTVWAFNSSVGDPHIQAYDLDTGAAVADFVAPHKDANRGRANGRGIAVLGTRIYYSLADTPNVYITDTVTHADLGIAFTTPLSPGINSLAWDGANLWLVASQPQNPAAQDDKVYKYSPTGALLQTLVLPRPANSNLVRDGIEITPAGIVADRNSVPYDVYDFSGHLIQADLITASFRTTGIAFDGTNYIVSDALNGKLAIFDQAGNFLRSVALTGASIPFGIFDLAVVRAAQAPQFTAAAVDNAASFTAGPVAPGEFLAIFGSGMGPDVPATTSLNAAGLVDNVLATTRVLFDGVAAPLTYSSSNQVNVVVPYSVAGKTSTQVQIEFQNVRSAAVPMPVVTSAPGIFVIVNPDGSVNSTGNPAPKGSIVVIYATGEGQTNPAGVDGKLAAAVLPLPAPLLQVTARINNVLADVLYAGAAPTLVAGVLQVNVRLPLDTPAGDMPIVLQVGTASSVAAKTIAVQ
jgi:uncharacterized protein (TIGR03437 family)